MPILDTPKDMLLRETLRLLVGERVTTLAQTPSLPKLPRWMNLKAGTLVGLWSVERGVGMHKGGERRRMMCNRVLRLSTE